VKARMNNLSSNQHRIVLLQLQPKARDSGGLQPCSVANCLELLARHIEKVVPCPVKLCTILEVLCVGVFTPVTLLTVFPAQANNQPRAISTTVLQHLPASHLFARRGPQSRCLEPLNLSHSHKLTQRVLNLASVALSVWTRLGAGANSVCKKSARLCNHERLLHSCALLNSVHRMYASTGTPLELTAGIVSGAYSSSPGLTLGQAHRLSVDAERC